MSDNTILGINTPGMTRLPVLESAAGRLGWAFPSRRPATAAQKYLKSRVRRILELSIAITLLIVLLPILCVIALGVRITSPGPIFFRQWRHGKSMSVFEMVKFRSMSWRPADEVKQAGKNDARVTSIGRILRRASLDELPQIVSVIKGDMSLIGPRPHAIEHDCYYRELISGYGERFRARPGITGLAQVSGARGPTPRVEDMQRRIDLDIWYLRNASLALDCRILLRTVKEVFASESAF